MGWLTDLWNSAKNTVSNLWTGTKNLASELYNRGSTIFTGGHYLGPFNSLDPEYVRTHPPVDEADRAGYHHDIEYQDIAKRVAEGTLNQSIANRLARESDNRFLTKMGQEWTTSPWKSTLGYIGIKGKNLLEDAGILNPNMFVRMKCGGMVNKIY